MPSLCVELPVSGQLQPTFSLGVGDRVGRFGKTFVSEAAARHADLLRHRGDVPEERRATDGAEVPFLIVILCCVMEGIHLGFALAHEHC